MPFKLSSEPLIEPHQPPASMKLTSLTRSEVLRLVLAVHGLGMHPRAARAVVVLLPVPDDARPIALTVAIRVAVLLSGIVLARGAVELEHACYPISFLRGVGEGGAASSEHSSEVREVLEGGPEISVGDKAPGLDRMVDVSWLHVEELMLHYGYDQPDCQKWTS